MIDTRTPGLAEALSAVARLTDDELVSVVAGGQAREREALAAGEEVVAQAAAFYTRLGLLEIERRCFADAQ